MLIPKAFVAVATLANAVTALYPWYPDYKCAELPSCPSKSSSKVDARDDSIRIKQRLPNNDVPHDTQVQRLAERLSHKYRIAASVRNTLEDGLEKRINTQAITPAAIPTTPNSAGIDQDGTDFSYLTNVKLGSKGKTVNLLLDTGAGTSWVMGTDCASEPCKTRNSFGPADSDTFVLNGNGFSLHYGSGNVNGAMGHDTLSVAGLEINATFGLANTTSPDFNNFPIDGILGLAPAKGDNPTFVQALVASKLLKANLFGVSINRAADGPNDGVINFGAPDTSRFSGDLGYNSLLDTNAGDWAINLDEVSYEGSKAGIKFNKAFIDTGTSYIFTTEDEVKRLHDTVPGSSTTDGITYRVPCTTKSPVKFSFGGSVYEVSAEDWVGPIVDGQCTSNIYGHDVVGEGWLLGDTFLKNVYAVFDVDQGRIGFAPKKAPQAQATTTSSTISTGGPTSLSKLSSSTLASSTITSKIVSSGSSITQESSNRSSTETSTATSTPTPPTEPLVPETNETPTPPENPPGLGGHQTSGTTGAEPGQVSAPPTPTPTNQSGATRLDNSLTNTVIALLGLFAIVS